MPEDVSLDEAEQYYRVESSAVDNVIRAKLRGKDSIVFGARAVNAYLPSYLDKHTEDWDILAKENPRKIAKALEKALDERYGGDYFVVEPAKHFGTFRVKSKVTKRAVADITMIDEHVPHERKFGINFATLDHQIKNIEKSLADPKSKFRHDKDRETLQRIRIYQKGIAERGKMLEKPAKLVRRKTLRITPKRPALKR